MILLEIKILTCKIKSLKTPRTSQPTSLLLHARSPEGHIMLESLKSFFFRLCWSFYCGRFGPLRLKNYYKKLCLSSVCHMFVCSMSSLRIYIHESYRPILPKLSMELHLGSTYVIPQMFFYFFKLYRVLAIFYLHSIFIAQLDQI